MNGRFLARAVSGGLGETKDGKEQVAVEFEFTEPELKGQRITWFGYFTEKTWERTVESLRIAGWRGNDIDDLTGLGDNEVSLVLEEEEYEGKIQTRVRWVNAPSAGLTLKSPLSPERARSFAQQMKVKILGLDKSKGRTGTRQTARPTQSSFGGGRPPEPPPISDDDIPF